MSLPKKKSRTVSVGDKNYRYLIKAKRGDEAPMLIVQEDCKHPGAPLLLSMSSLHITGGSILKSNWGVGPGDVRKVIQKATETGWDPSKKGAGYIHKDVITIVREGESINHCPCMMTPCPHA